MTLALRSALFAALLLPAPALAQSGFEMPQADAPPPAEESAPGDLIGRGLEALMGEMLGRAAPHLEALGSEMEAMVDDLSPALSDLSALVDDIGNYQRPERLPNGDILIRRRPDAPPAPPLEHLAPTAPGSEEIAL